MSNLRLRILAALLTALGAAVSVCACAAEFDDWYVTHRTAALQKCEAIDPDDYQSGLAFNPDGYRSYYKRSECLQSTAAVYRDESLCKDVKERWTLLWSSWAISEKRCRELVAEGLDKDRPLVEKIRHDYAAGPARLVDFRIQNNNGVNYGIFPKFERGYQYRYTLRFELVAPDAPGGTALLAAYTGPFGYGNSVGLNFTAADLRQRFPAFESGRSYPVRATLVLEVPNGGASLMWSPAVIEKIFPRAMRTQTLEKEVTF
jgi:hypothetical protein